MQAIDPALPSASAEEARTVTTAATTVFLTLVFIVNSFAGLEGLHFRLGAYFRRGAIRAMRA